jgi:AcrR family transcriptional regulator
VKVDKAKVTEKPHHHGNLRAALIAAGLDLLNEDGVDGLTLRRAAAKAGVSHAAPAHHFNGKHGLVVAIAAEGFRTFTRIMEEDRFDGGNDAQAQLLGICTGYLRFATEHPALFRLIFSPTIKNDPDPELQEASKAAFMVLSEVCGLFEPSPKGEGANELMIWSLVHGYASLRATQQMQNPRTHEAVPFVSILPPMRVKHKIQSS